MITIFGLTVNKNDPQIQEYKKLSILNIKDNFRKAVHIRPLYYNIGDLIIFPRFGTVDNFFVSKLKKTPEVSFFQVGKLLDNQVAVVDNIMNKWFSKESVECGRGGVILKMDMGTGKSFVAMELIGRIRRKTLIVCHVTNMIDQWKKVLGEWFKDITIGEISGRARKNGDVVVGLIQTLSKNLVPKLDSLHKSETVDSYKFFSEFEFIIFDEAHLYCSQTYSNIFRNCQVRHMLGLSGTPENKDLSHGVIVRNIGPIYDSGIVAEDKFEAEVELFYYSTPKEYTTKIYRGDTLNYQAIVDLVLSNPERVEHLVTKILELTKERNVFVFADRCDYLRLLKEKIEAAASCSLIIGGSSEKDLEAAERDSSVILTTYQYMSTGRSIKKMDALVFATPRKTKVEQTLGRIFRSGSSQTVRKIVDFLDVGTILMSQLKTRNIIYKEREYTVYKVYS